MKVISSKNDLTFAWAISIAILAGCGQDRKFDNPIDPDNSPARHRQAPQHRPPRLSHPHVFWRPVVHRLILFMTLNLDLH